MMTLKPISETSGFADWQLLWEINDEAFPEVERIPSDRFLPVLRSHGWIPYALYVSTPDGGERMVGFTVYTPRPDLRMAFVTYLAIRSDERGQGLGAQAIQALKDANPGCQLVLDMERLDPTADNYSQRQRRTAFYRRHGFERAGVGIQYYGMDLELMCTDGPFRQADFEALVHGLPGGGFNPYLYPLQ